ncbi:MAG: GNAT family N-acetyltransferase [Anaerolineales bacterium]|nr:GNAT family N-acetyltransferase [Anaerolineales bacterium]
MITQVGYSIRPATEEDRFQLVSLIQLEPYVHRHLDWRAPIDWLGQKPYYVAEKDGQLVAALACPADPPGVSWIRTFACAGSVNTWPYWKQLWSAAKEELSDGPEIHVAAIPLFSWFRQILVKSGFDHTHKVVVLAWDRQEVPAASRQAAVELQTMQGSDLPAVAEVDNLAFDTIWRNSETALSLAQKQSVSATVARSQEGIVGYQITTQSPYGWHLARLAVHPAYQRQGIAMVLLRDLLGQAIRKSQGQVTVNTQHNNPASLELYKKIGFRRTGEEYPVYQTLII